MGFQPSEQNIKTLFAAMVRVAFEDVRTFCEGRIHRDFRKKNGSTTRATEQAIQSMAWLLGRHKSDITVQAVCDSLGIDHSFLVARIERMLVGARYWQLRTMVSQIGGAA